MQLQSSNRYERQCSNLLSQDHIAKSTVLVIGAGGVGSPLLLYLTGAGVGKIIIADGDTVSLNNLHRQVLYREQDIGFSKAECAKRTLNSLNSCIEIEIISDALTFKNISNIDPSKLNLIIDCTDNAETMTLSNNFALKHRLPFMAGSAEGLEGIAMFFDYSDANYIKNYGCLNCLGYTPNVKKSVPFILGPAAGLIGTTLALEAIKFLGGMPTALYGRILRSRDGCLKGYALSADDNCAKHKDFC
jgi:molybdopterin/thiamine biosynthesis adenylyltransferase